MAPVDSQAKSSASWALECSEPVTGVDATDFQVTADSGVTWQSLDILGSGGSRIVTVSGTSGAGLVGLNLVDDGSIRDLDGNLLYGGPGVYLEPVRVPDAALHFSKLLTTDIDGDGALDVLSVNPSKNTLNFNRGLGNGALQHDSDLVLGGGLSAVTVADFNSDGLTDLAVALPENAAIAVLYGTAAGGFLPPQFTTTVTAARKLATGDVNADGFSDIIVGSVGEGSAQVFAGSVAGMQSGTILSFSSGLQNLIVDDIYQDGTPDVLMLTESREILISFGTGNGSFTNPQTLLYSSVVKLSTGDLNGGGPDIVTLTSFPLSTFFEFRSANAFGYFTKDGEQQVEHAPRTFTIGDFTCGFVTIVANFSPGNDAIPPIEFPEDTNEYRVPMTGITPGLGEESNMCESLCGPPQRLICCPYRNLS